MTPRPRTRGWCSRRSTRGSLDLCIRLVFLSALPGIPACKPDKPSPPTSSTTQPAPELDPHDRALAVFEHAIFFKPSEDPGVEQRLLQLAPLLMSVPSESDSKSGEWLPVVHWQASSVPLNGRPREQIAFVWPVPSEDRAAWRGCRMTLDDEGFPVIWEVLGGQPGPELLFVSKALEAAASSEFGPILSGRRFAIEASADAYPDVVVVRLLDDGPMPMGPFVYMDASHDITSLICRCMDSQVRNVVKSLSYALQPLSAESVGSSFPLPDPSRPARVLRLPSTF